MQIPSNSALKYRFISKHQIQIEHIDPIWVIIISLRNTYGVSDRIVWIFDHNSSARSSSDIICKHTKSLFSTS